MSIYLVHTLTIILILKKSNAEMLTPHTAGQVSTAVRTRHDHHPKSTSQLQPFPWRPGNHNITVHNFPPVKRGHGPVEGKPGYVPHLWHSGETSVHPLMIAIYSGQFSDNHARVQRLFAYVYVCLV